ncbi:MAG TPA: transketolase C-terminal domain-containing protein [Polyangiaceae bacterium]|jgi:transketolase|nr:transketolase C-terminal domain-containing protein [Polyangiaceae bacterium]
MRRNMGDLIGNAVEGSLYFLARSEFERITAAPLPKEQKTKLFANACRLNALYMIARAGSGHIGSSFSSLDIVSHLYLNELVEDATRSDIYFSSKGHDAPGLYAALLALGKLPFELLHQLRQLGGLPGHPDVSTPGINANTGSLGMGISKAKGMVLANRKLGRAGRLFVLTGDGELQEGQIWESLISAANFRLHEIVAIVDHNKLQSDTFVERTSSLGDLVAKFEAFGWHVQRVDGHDVAALSRAIAQTKQVEDRPHVIIADTVKGRGVSFMEHTSLDSDVAYYRFHSGAPDAAGYTRAAEELIGALNTQCDSLGMTRLAFDTVIAPKRAPAGPQQALIRAYAKALLDEMKRTPELMVLDADLAVDIGVQPVREAFPDRFIECGIAEMDMVSMSSGLARRGLLPICHSFACFLSTRANEHFYNNASEHARVVYVASLAGVVPGGPGHSHQSVRDISAIGGVPGLIAIAPSSEGEVSLALHFATQQNKEATYLRLESVPCAVPYELPQDYRLEPGIGVTLREGRDALFIGYGPVLLSEAFRAAEKLAEEGVEVGVVNLPWLNLVDSAWLARTVAGVAHLFSFDNHLAIGGQGDRIANALASAGFQSAPRLHRFAVEGIPACGSNADVLRQHGLDERSIFERVLRVLRG